MDCTLGSRKVMICTAGLSSLAPAPPSAFFTGAAAANFSSIMSQSNLKSLGSSAPIDSKTVPYSWLVLYVCAK